MIARRPRSLLALRSSGELLPWLALVAVYFLWGSTYVAIRVAVRGLPPFALVSFRYLVAGVILYAAAARGRQARRPTAREWGASLLVGSLLLVGGNGLVTLGEKRVAAGPAALIVASVPLWLVVFEAARGKVRLAPSLLVGLAIGLAGVALLVAPGGSGGIDPLGGMTIVVAAISWALGSLASRDLPVPQGLMGAASELICGGLAGALTSAAAGEWQQVDPAKVGWHVAFALAWLIVPGSLLGFTAYVYALRRLPTPTVSTYAYANPLVAVALGWLLLGERLTLRSGLAAAVIVASVVLIVARRAQHEVESPRERSQVADPAAEARD